MLDIIIDAGLAAGGLVFLILLELALWLLVLIVKEIRR